MKPFKFLSLIKNSELANTVKIYPFSRISNSKIDANSYVSYGCVINNSKIGKFCSIAQNVKIGLGIHPTNFISISPVFYSPKNPLGESFSKQQKFIEAKPVTISHDVWIGTNVTIIDGVHIGIGSIIGANSVVTRDVPPYSIVGGVPAKEIKKRFSPEICKKLLKSQWWNMPNSFFEIKEISEIFSQKLTATNLDYLIKLINEFKQDREN